MDSFLNIMNSTLNSTLPNIPPPNQIGVCPESSVFNVISTTAGSLAFISSMIAQFPQLIETYRDKTVEGVSNLLLLSWLGGDITSIIGAILTNQLPFQIVLAIYFLSNDLIICAQYYYYGIYHGNRLATAGHQHLDPSSVATKHSHLHHSHLHHHHHHENNENSVTTRVSGPAQTPRKSILAGVLSFFSLSRAMPITSSMLQSSSAIVLASSTNNQLSALGMDAQTIGTFCSWIGALFYFCSRIPQLLKNYHRKSTDGVSPLLFYCTIFHNCSYGISIFTSCQFVYNEDKWGFVKNEAPFLLGSVGTLLFDFIYLYQHFVLYNEDTKLRRQLSRQGNRTPSFSGQSHGHIQSSDSDNANENSPLLISSS